MEDRDAREILEAAGHQIEVGADAADARVRIHAGQDRIGERPLPRPGGAGPVAGARRAASGADEHAAASAQRRDRRAQRQASTFRAGASSSISRRAIQAQDGATGDGIVRAPRASVLEAANRDLALHRRLRGAVGIVPDAVLPERSRSDASAVLGGGGAARPSSASAAGASRHDGMTGGSGATWPGTGTGAPIVAPAAEQALEPHHADELRADLRPQHDQQRAREDQQPASCAPRAAARGSPT